MESMIVSNVLERLLSVAIANPEVSTRTQLLSSFGDDSIIIYQRMTD